jgi:hypothetical protein
MSFSKQKSQALQDRIRQRKDERRARKQAKKNQRRWNPTKAQIRRQQERSLKYMDRYVADRAWRITITEEEINYEIWPPFEEFDFSVGLNEPIKHDWKKEGF